MIAELAEQRAVTGAGHAKVKRQESYRHGDHAITEGFQPVTFHSEKITRMQADIDTSYGLLLRVPGLARVLVGERARPCGGSDVGNRPGRFVLQRYRSPALAGLAAAMLMIPNRVKA